MSWSLARFWMNAGLGNFKSSKSSQEPYFSYSSTIKKTAQIQNNFSYCHFDFKIWYRYLHRKMLYFIHSINDVAIINDFWIKLSQTWKSKAAKKRIKGSHWCSIAETFIAFESIKMLYESCLPWLAALSYHFLTKIFQEIKLLLTRSSATNFKSKEIRIVS